MTYKVDQIIGGTVINILAIGVTGFLNRHLSAIVDFAGRYVGQKSDAEDIAQDTFLRVWHKASSWRSEGASLRSWLYRIAYNLCIDNLRRRRYDMDIDEMELQIDSHGPEETVSNQAQSRRLVIALAALPERQRTALTLCAYHGLSNKEAAVVMDINVEALESLLSRRKLRKSLILDTGGPS